MRHSPLGQHLNFCMEFQVILDRGSVNDSSSKQELAQILTRECGVSFIEFDLNMEQAPISVAVGLSLERANSLKQKLEAAGAKVLLVQSALAPTSTTSATQQSSYRRLFRETYSKYQSRLRICLESIDVAQVETLGMACLQARQQGRQILLMGNGGSAATASHLANDILKHGHADPRFSFRAISLTDNTPWITAISNDFGYDQLFVQQLRNLLREGDVVIAISSSGNSPNILRGVEYANEHGSTTFGVVGFGGGKLSSTAQHVVMIPTNKGDYGVMEDGSMILGHMLSEFFAHADKVFGSIK